MKLSDFSYSLPEELIAQTPRPQRDASRMMVLDRHQQAISDDLFSSISERLHQGDVLVINDSRVIPARIYGRKNTGAILEILLLSRREIQAASEIWEVLARPGKRIAQGDAIDFGHGCKGQVLARLTEKKWLMTFSASEGFDHYLDRHGRAPLPPYIKRKKSMESDSTNDRDRYQTIYAKSKGSIAAPTAGLHFSQSVMQALEAKGIVIAPITLHVGIGTFLPIETRHIEDHVMETEYFEISPDSAEKINNAARVIAVGTTSTRAIESASDTEGHVTPQAGLTQLFIYPGYTFKRVNGLLTNFHLPESSLFLLVCAFAGTDFMKKAYTHAIDRRYFFYSYGDCMLIL
jgi:S-adenosylmethionine:tRNA ribosyltransferase-isomerase